MELCDESLYDFVWKFRGKIWSTEKKLLILQDIARGMVYIHGQNIVHGDLRSSNILLCHSEGQTVAKIADFDMARFLDPDTQHHFTVRFTAEYLPPEMFDHKEHKDQKKGWARLTPKVDVFCFGELVLEMGCGSYPTPTGKFQGRELLTELQRREKHLAKLKQSDKESLGSIIRKCLADAPEGRPSFTEILLEVDAYLHMYGERPDLEVLQDKTAECEALRAEAVKWEGEAKSLCSVQDELEKELEKERTEKQDLQINLQMQQIKVEELQQQIQEALSKKTNEHAEVMKEVASLREALEQKASNIGELQSKSHDQEKVIQRLSRDRLNVQQEVEQLKIQRDTFKQKLDDAQTSLKTSKEHTASVEEQLDHFQKKFYEKESANAKLLRTVKDMEEEMKEVKQQKAKLESSAKGQGDRITQLKAENSQLEQDVKRLNDEIDLHKQRLDRAMALKETANRERDSAISDKERTKKELAKQRGMFAKERQQFEEQIAAEERAKRNHQEDITQLEDEVKQKESDMKQLHQQYNDCARLRDKYRNDTEYLQSEVERLSSQLDRSKKERIELMEKWTAVEQQKQNAEEQVSELQSDNHTWKTQSESTEKEFKASKAKNKELTTKIEKLTAEIRQLEQDVKHLNDEIDQQKRRLDLATTLKETANRERDSATSDKERTKKELVRQMGKFAKERQQFQEQIAAEERAKRNHQERLGEAQKKEHDLNDQLRQYHNKLEASEGAKDKLERAKETLEAEKVAFEKQVRELTYKLELRAEDLSKKEKQTFNLMKELEEAQKAVAEGNELEPVLRQSIEELEEEKKELLKNLDDKDGKSRKLQRELAEAMEALKTLEEERDQKMETIRVREDKLKDVQRREQDLNDQLQLYHNQLEATKVALQVERDKLHSTEESVCQKEKEVEKLKGDLQSERDKVQTLGESALQKERELDQCKDSKAAMEKDLVRARKMAKDLLDERVVVSAESEQQMENLNERLMEFKQQAVLSEERLKQVQGLEGEHLDLKVQLKTLTTTLEDFQKVLTDEQKSRKSLDASVKALRAEIDQLRTELKERDNEVSSLAAANKHLQRKVDAADTNSGEMKAKITQLRTELKERDNKVSSLAAANGGLQRKVNAADADITEMKAKSTSLKEQVKALSNDKKSLKQTLNATEAALQKHKNDYKDCQEKLREAEQQVALFQGKRQQLEVFERVAVELKSRLSDLMMDAPPLLTPSVGGGKDGSSAVALTQEAAQKVHQLESERDSLKAERHMYQMKWLAAEDMLEAVKSEKQSLENNLELTRQAFQSTKVHLQVTEQSLREEYKKKFSEAYEVMKSLQQEQEEGGAQHPPDRIKLDALMDICRYYKDERDKEIERAAAEKHCILASKKEADERAEAMACKIASLKECIEVRDGEIKRIKAQLVPHKMEAAPVPLPSDVVDVTADEALLQQLCYMATGIKKLLVSADGGRFTLGSGDASLEFPPGAVEKETSVRYAIILHGPFVFPAGYKPGSVIIYLNMEGATLLKPVILYLSHWCIKEKGEDEDTLKFVSASHTLGAAEAGQQAYVFEEEDDADFTRTNVAVLSIRDPHCLFCVENKSEKVAMYSAIAFSHYIPSEETLLFRIQLMCDSLEWNEKLTSTLQLKNWEKTSDGDIVTRFQCDDGQHRITASPKEMSGPGWRAAIYGQQAVIDEMFLEPLRKTKEEVEQEVSNGRFPPCILYKIIYTGLEVNRVKSALVNIVLHGANVPLSFSCRVKEEMPATPPVSPAYSEPVFGAATSPIPMETALVSTRDILTALDHRLDAKWRHFGAFLCVEYQVMEAIQRDKGGNPEDCMLDLLSKWTSNQAGLGTLPRTWQTVVETVHHCGDAALAQSLARKHGGHLPH